MKKSQSIKPGSLYTIDIFLISFACLITVSALGIEASNQGELFGLNQKAQMALEGMLVILFFIGLLGFAVDLMYRLIKRIKCLLTRQN